MAQQNGGFCSLFRAKLLIILVLGFGLYLIVPPVYWHFVDEAGGAPKHSACPACLCDCDAENFASVQLSSLSNLPLGGTDCGNEDPEWQKERDASSEEQLREQLELQKSVAAENKQRADTAYLDAKKLSSQYQKEAEKCNIGMETSEEARERAEAALTAERKKIEIAEAALAAEKQKSALWRKRAKELGWTEDEGDSHEVADMKLKVIDSKEQPSSSSFQEDAHDPELNIGVSRTSNDLSSSGYKKKSLKKRRSRSIST